MGGIFDLASQIGFYASYHNDPINQWIHIVGVPSIVWSAMVLLNYFSPLFEVDGIPAEYEDYVIFSMAFPVLCVYVFYYIILDPVAGFLYAPILIFQFLSANYFYSTNENAFAIAGIIQVVAWVSQFIGHGVFEGRAPALLDNLVQAFLQAPFFVWLELLFKVGYRKELQEELRKEVKGRLNPTRTRSSKKAKTQALRQKAQ